MNPFDKGKKPEGGQDAEGAKVHAEAGGWQGAGIMRPQQGSADYVVMAEEDDILEAVGPLTAGPPGLDETAWDLSAEPVALGQWLANS